MNRNTIYYQFLSENKKYCINFNTTEISIGDIKKEISRRRNMERAPDKFELLFYDDTNTEIRDENFRVEPLKTLVIKRIPSYKLNPQFTEVIYDPSQIPLMKGNEFNFTKSQYNFVNAAEPLEKISSKLTLEMLDEKFRCKVCKKKEEEGYKYLPVLLLCCNDTICQTCYEKSEECPQCKEAKKGFIPNNSELELKEKLYEIYNKMKENAIQMQKQMQLNQQQSENASHLNGGIMRPNLSVMPKNHSILNQNRIVINNIAQNPSYPLFDNARFFIIKSSNKENLEISQKYSEWATTLTNQKKLNEAFQTSNVILIFSANRTGCFQGYAIMTSFIGEKRSNLWQNENNVKLGGSFGVYWLCLCEMPFNRAKNLTNPINGGELVTKSRDTQELPKDIGQQLITLCYEQEKSEINSNKQPKSITQEIINKINEDIRQSREKQNQLQTSRMAMNPMAPTPVIPGVGVPPIRPMAPMMNGQMGTGFYNPYMMAPGNPYMYPGMFPMIPSMQLQQQLMQQQSQNKERERSRDKSAEKGKSRSASHHSTHSNRSKH